jgi:hypothetical protein
MKPMDATDRDREWYCVCRGQRIGPLSWERLRDLVAGGLLARDDLVWEESFGDRWRQAAEVAGLWTPAETEAPRPPAETPPPGPAEKTAGDEPRPVMQFAIAMGGGRPRALAAARDAWRRMSRILFRPLNLARWFSIGFCAWLMTINAGGCHAGIDQEVLKLKASLDAGENLAAAMAGRAERMLPMLLAGTMTGIVMAVCCCWLRARGTFMVLHRLHRPAATIRESWRVAGRTAMPLFWWRLGLGLTAAAAALATVTGAAVTLMAKLLQHSFSWRLAAAAGDGIITPLWLAVWTGLLATVAAGWLALHLLTMNFVEPVMYWRDIGVKEAWQVVGSLCRQHPLAVLRFYLALLVWNLAGGVAIVLFILLSCGLGLLLLLIPFIQAVTLLPLTLFFRGLGPEFLAAWRPDLPADGNRTASQAT